MRITKISKMLSVAILTSLLGSNLVVLPSALAAEQEVFSLSKSSGSGEMLGDTQFPELVVDFRNKNLDTDNHEYRQVVFDESNGVQTFIGSCDLMDDEESCTLGLIEEELIRPGEHRYTAYLDESNEYYGFDNIDIDSISDLDNNIGQSNTLSWYKNQNSISLSSPTNFFSTDYLGNSNENYPELYTFFPENPLTSDYLYYTFDTTNDELLTWNQYDKEGWPIWTFPEKNNDTVTFQTFLANGENREQINSVNDLQDIQATSNIITHTRRPWVISGLENFIGGIDIIYTQGGGDKTVYLEDKTNGKIIWSSQDSGSSYQAGSNGHDEESVDWARAHVGDPWTGTKPTNISQVKGIIANSDGLKDKVKTPGIEDPEQIAGGTNPSENCTQSCAGDPINLYTGEFFDSKTDLTMAGSIGIKPSATRHFSTQKKAELGLMGYGWRNSYEMSIKSATDDPLATAKRVKVVQENGSASFFDKNTDGTFSTSASTKATLSFNASTGYSFVRDKRDTFKFTVAGKLSEVKDIHGNTLTVSYTSNRLSSVADSLGNSLTFQYNSAGLIEKINSNNGRSSTYTYSSKRLTTVLDENGMTTSYTYDGQRRVKTITDVSGGIMENFYDSSSRVIRQNDQLGKQTKFTYEYFPDSQDQETTITSPDGSIVHETYVSGLLLKRTEGRGTPQVRTWQYVYDKTNNIISTLYPDRSADSSFYDDEGNMIRHVDALGAESAFTYDSLDNVLTMKNPLGKTITNSYDAKGNLLSSTTPLLSKTMYSWNTNGSLKSTTDPKNNATQFSYNVKGLLKDSTTPLGNTTVNTYDVLGRQTESILPKGVATTSVPNDYMITSTYNKKDLPNTIKDQKGKETTITYDDAGNVLTTTDAKGNVMSHTYDLMGRLLSTTTADGTSSMTYDSMGRVLTATDNKGNTATNTYNKVGNLISVTDPLGKKTSYEYDTLGRVTKTTDAIGGIQKMRYDAKGNLIIATDELGAITKYSYNKAGQVTSVSDKENRVTSYLYDDDGQNISTNNPDGSMNSQTFDKNGNVATKTNGEDKTESWTFDADNRVTSYKDAEDEIVPYEYDKNGNIVKTIREDGSLVLTEYDQTDLPTTENFPGTESDVSYSYDDLGFMTGETKGDLTTTTAYDHAGRILSRGTPGKNVTYEYDTNGQQEKVTYPSGRKVSYVYDANGRMASMNTVALGNATFNYNNRGENTSTILPNGVTESRDTDLLGRTTKIDISNTTSKLHEITKSYTASGNISASSYGLATDPNKINETYSHDKMDRTQNVNSTFIGSNSQNTYNDAGQLTKFNGSTVTLDNIGKPLSVGNMNLDYDSLGNRTSETLSSSNIAKSILNWDSSGLLEQVAKSESSTTVDYAYTADGLIDARNKNNTTGSEEFVWDSTTDNALMLSDGNYEYIYGVNRVPLAQVNTYTDEATYLHADVNGSVIASTTTNGTLAGVTNYNAYGKRLGANLSSFGFAGEWTDGDTGYVFLRARWYDPNTGHFLSKDPIVQATGESYGYAGGNPLTRIDPSGMFINAIDLLSRNTEIIPFGQETIQAGMDGDDKKVKENVGKALVYVGTAAAVSAFVIGTGGIGASTLGVVSVTATVGGTAIGIDSTVSTCSEEGFSKNCKWGAINTATGSVPLLGKMNKLKFIENEALAYRTIQRVNQKNKWDNMRMNNKISKKRIHEMSTSDFNAMKRRSNAMAFSYLSANTIGMGTFLSSSRENPFYTKKDSSCKQ